MIQIRGPVAFAFCLAGVLIPSANASLVATYTFNNTLAAQQAGVAPLVPVDPQGTSGFQNAVVFGNARNTWHFDGTATPSQQGGLNFNTTALIAPNQYSVEMVFELTGANGWRRLMDALDRQSDAGLYIDPGNNLDVFPNGGTSSPFTANTFFDVFVTIAPTGTNNVAGYFSGIQQFTLTSNVLNVQTNFLGFFLDNVVSSGQGEWSSGNIALLKVFNTALTPAQVMAETEDPFQGTNAPEPGTWMLMLAGAAAIAVRKVRG